MSSENNSRLVDCIAISILVVGVCLLILSTSLAFNTQKMPEDVIVSQD